MSSTAAAQDGDLINPSSSSPNQPTSPSPPHPHPPSAVAATSSAADPSSPPDASSPTNSPIMTGLTAPPPASNSSSRRLPPPCWTHDETLALLDSYRDKWYALRKGNLRASHWQDVADAVARRCANLASATPKTSVQCRHKIEKLRKRYRSERTRSLSHDPTGPPTSSWVYFRKIDLMENGSPGAGAASAGGGVGRTPPSPPSSSSPSASDNDDDEDPHITSQTRSLHRLMANGAGSAAPPPPMPMGFRFTVPKAVRSKISGPRSPATVAPSSGARFFFKGYSPGAAAEEMRRRVERRRQREREREPMTASAAAGHVAAALRALGDGFMRVEYTKMDMAKEIEKVRMDMELKRTKMILDAQRQIVDAFAKGLNDRKRAKVSQEP